MNYMPGRMPPPNMNPNMVYYGPAPIRQPQVINPRMYNQVMPNQHQFVPQPVFYPQQYGHSPTRSNQGTTFVNPFAGQPQIMPQYSLPNLRTQPDSMRPLPPIKSSPIKKKSSGPSFNASEPMDYNRVYSNANSNNPNSTQGSHSQQPSTFAMASNSMLRRSDVGPGLYQPGSTTSSQNNLLRPSQNNQFQQSNTHGNQLIRVNSQNPMTPVRNERERQHNEHLRDSLVRSGLTTLDSPNVRHRPGMSYNITATIIPLRNGQPITTSPTRASSWIEESHGTVSNRNRQNNQWSSLLNTHEDDNEQNHTTPGGLTIRPAMVQVTFADPNLTNMTLTNLRSNFNNDEMFGEELMRINDLINFMVGTSENQTNWVGTFIEQFFTQVNDLPKEAKVLTDDAIANLPTITFKTTKKPKAKKNQDETLNSENLCAICLVDYENGDTLTVLPCNHNFHNDCVGAWLKKKAECPTCRQTLE